MAGVTVLRLSRCCRSLNGATSPSRSTSSSPSSTTPSRQAPRPHRERRPRYRRRCARRGVSRRPDATACTRMPSHFHSATKSVGSISGKLLVLDRVRQHQRPEHGRVRRPRAAGRSPRAKRTARCIRWREPVPDLLDLGERTPDHSASAVLASRAETPTRSAPVRSLSSAQRPVASSRVEPAREQRRAPRLAGADCSVSTTVASRGGLSRFAAFRPDQRDGLGRVADIVARQIEQHGIDARPRASRSGCAEAAAGRTARR